MKVIFVGDPHFDSVTPVSRLDDYRAVSLAKLNEILDIAIKNDVSQVIFTGDFFDKLDQSLIYLHELVNILNQFKQHSIKVKTLVGNHDLKYNNYDYFDTTTLSLLLKTGVVDRLHHILDEENNVNIYGLSFNQLAHLEEIAFSPNYYNILVMHYAVNDTVPGESLSTKNELKGFNMVISGHDHKYYPPEVIDGVTVLRPGSMVRRTKESYNLTRSVVVYLVNTESKSYTEIKLTSAKPAEEVFKYEAITGSLPSLHDSDFSKLFSEDFFKSETTGLKEIIEELPETITKESKLEIIKYLESQGLTFKD